MSLIKTVLIILGLIIAATLAFSVIGMIYSALWYLFLLGVVAIGGAVGYKLLVKNKNAPELEDKTPITIAEIKNADRALEEYKRKYLSE